MMHRLCISLIVVLLVGCESQPPKQEAFVWVEDPYAWVTRDAEVPAGAPEAILKTQQAINEREHASFVLKAAARLNSVQVRIRPSDRAGKGLDSQRVQVREVKWLAPAAGAGSWRWYYDAWLTKEPMPELLEDVVDPMQLEAGEARHIWLTVRSHGMAPGQYEATVEVTSQDQVVARLPLQVNVWDIDLPLDPSIIGHQLQSLPGPARLAERYGEFASQYYSNTRQINYPNATDGQPDWNHWDWTERARVMGKHGMNVIISLPRVPGQFGGPSKERVDLQVEEMTGVPFEQMLTQMVARLREAGVASDQIYVYAYDEVEEINEQIVGTFKNIKRIAPTVKIILCTGSAKNILSWLKEKNGLFDEIQQYVDIYMTDKGVLTEAFEVETDIEIFRQVSAILKRAIPLEAKYREHIDPLFQYLEEKEMDPDTKLLNDWLRSEQKKGKKIIWYWNQWRSAMVRDDKLVLQNSDGRRIPGILEGERFSFWKTWRFDLDGGVEASSTPIWHQEWTYFDETVPINAENFPEPRNLEWYREASTGSMPIFSWQPPEHQMLHLVEHVRVLPNGDFRMVSTKRLEALADGVRDYLYLGSLEQVAWCAVASGDEALQKAGKEALAILSQQYLTVVSHPFHSHSYQTARQELARILEDMKRSGLEVETDQKGRLVRHRRYGPQLRPSPEQN